MKAIKKKYGKSKYFSTPLARPLKLRRSVASVKCMAIAAMAMGDIATIGNTPGHDVAGKMAAMVARCVQGAAAIAETRKAAQKPPGREGGV